MDTEKLFLPIGGSILHENSEGRPERELGVILSLSLLAVPFPETFASGTSSAAFVMPYCGMLGTFAAPSLGSDGMAVCDEWVVRL